jgi:glycosyltransferase involved in cell wall biosynthesis
VIDRQQSQQLNILYHHRTQGRGAEGVHITSIVKALKAQGHTVTIVSPPGIDPLQHAGNAPVDKSNVKTSGLDTIWKFISKYLPNFLFEIIEILYNIPANQRLSKELDLNHYDLIYERYAFFMFAGARLATKHKIPFVLEANEVSGIKERARKQSFNKLCNRIERYIFCRCTSIHTVSSYLKQMILKQGIIDTKVVVTPNAIDPEKFSGARDAGDLIDKYHLKGKVVLGFAGWFDHWDRLDLLVDVFRKLKVVNVNLMLVLVGDGAVLDDVKKKLCEFHLENDVILTGAVSRLEVHHYLSLFDIAVITHSNEFGSPVVMFEFMGLKIPIVAPRLMPVTDVLSDNENALLFDVLDMDQLQSRLEGLIENKELQEKLAEQAYRKLLKDHTWSSNARDIVVSAGY